MADKFCILVERPGFVVVGLFDSVQDALDYASNRDNLLLDADGVYRGYERFTIVPFVGIG